MTPLQEKVDKSIIELNASEIAVNGKKVQLDELELIQEKHKLDFEETQDYRHGIVSFTAEIEANSVIALSTHLRRLTRLRPKQPIRIEFNCNGGTINHGLHLIDDITVIGKECPITIAVRGQAASMGAVILQAAQKRLVGPCSYIMLHRASFGVEGSADDVEDSVKEVQMFEKRIYEIIAKRTGKTVEFWKKQLGRRKDVWYTADEAVKIGLADGIG